VRRREFITLLSGAATWPLAARAQQPRMPVIGFFHLTSLEWVRELLAAFHRGLGDTGYIEGRNVAIEYRWAQGQNDRPTLAAELVRRQVSVIVILESTHGAHESSGPELDDLRAWVVIGAIVGCATLVLWLPLLKQVLR
jgi:hypothetical protein